MYSKSDVDYVFKFNYKSFIGVYSWKLQMDLDKDNFKRRNKDTRRKQEIEFYLWDLTMFGRKKEETTKLVYLTVIKY